MKNETGFHQLYRHFASDGTLLYVGVSVSALARLSAHGAQSCWANQISTVTIENFASRDEAIAAEWGAIEAERPKHNVVGNPDAGGKPKSAANRRSGLTREKLTEEQIRNAQASSLQDGGGLLINIRGDGGRWVYRYQIDKRRRDMGLGSWPAVTLQAARQRRDYWERILAAGIDPIEERKSRAAAL